jgi:DNA-nicking Smr family endonuclease
MDWEAWARRAEAALDVSGSGDWTALFAPRATFTDPANPSTSDLGDIAKQTRNIFPDWRQEITWIRGGDDFAIFEWIGRGTYQGEASVEMHGATVIEVDADGLVTRWKDYLDRKEPEEQLRAFYKGA